MRRPGYSIDCSQSQGPVNNFVAILTRASMLADQRVELGHGNPQGSFEANGSRSGCGGAAGRVILLLWIGSLVRQSALRFICKPFRVQLIGLTLALIAAQQASAGGIAVLEFELNDLTLNPNVIAETERTATLRPLLVEQLTVHHNITVIENPASARIEAEKGKGYLFDRPALAAKIGREVGVDWIVSGRLHKASFLFVYLKAQLINTQTDQVAADLVVEIKGPQQKLTRKGVESLAQQINTALEALGAE